MKSIKSQTLELLKTEPSSASLCEIDQLTESSSCEEDIGSDSEKSSDTESCIGRGSSGNNVNSDDIVTSSDDHTDIEPASSDSCDGEFH